jgi:hypothetical protein
MQLAGGGRPGESAEPAGAAERGKGDLGDNRAGAAEISLSFSGKIGSGLSLGSADLLNYAGFVL